MTFPVNKHLSDYPFIGSFPFHLSINRVDQHFPQHRHDFLEFSYVKEGQGYESVNGVRHPLRAGTFTFILPYQVHEIFSEPGTPLTLVNCMFGLELLGDKAEKLILSEHSPIRTHYDLHGELDQQLVMLLNRMRREYEIPDFWQHAIIKGLLLELLAFLDRSFTREAPLYGKEAPKSRIHAWELMRYIHIHYREPLTLVSMGEQFRCHPSRITQILSKHFGASFISLLQEVRIRHACSLLASTDMKILDIAYEVGYESFSSFSRNFRAKVGVSPSDYRQTNSQQ
jgi:AraC-like DNA-binding protein